MTILDDARALPVPAEAEAERLDPKVVRAWQVDAALGWMLLAGLAAAALFVADRPPAWALLAAFIGLIYVLRVPPHRYRHFVFRVGPVDVRVAHGWLWHTESVVLHSRIQHVDTRQGPIERTMGLATVVVFTAGSVGAMVAVPGLATARAEALRDQLVRLSGADDGV